MPFEPARHQLQVIALWSSVFSCDSRHNDPRIALQKKEEINDGLLFVAETEAGNVAGAIMGGYDGHRGWIYSLAVLPEHRNRGIGTGLVQHTERELITRGCMKINLQVLPVNREVERFYRQLGFEIEERISMGKRIP